LVQIERAFLVAGDELVELTFERWHDGSTGEPLAELGASRLYTDRLPDGEAVAIYAESAELAVVAWTEQPSAGS
jgi:hypothetical protein